MLWVSCLYVENPENQADRFWASLPKIQICHYILYTKDAQKLISLVLRLLTRYFLGPKNRVNGGVPVPA